MSSNRKGRRADRSQQVDSTAEIALVQPDRSKPRGKTLLDIAAERRPSLVNASSGRTTPSIVKMDMNGTIIPPESDTKVAASGQAKNPIGPLGEAIFYSINLTILHFTLDVLVHQQYMQAIDWASIITRTMPTFPVLMLIVYPLHKRAGEMWVQCLFLVMSIAAGCYLTYVSNEQGYFAVMKRAPPVGTLWIWAVVEMRLEFALASCLAVLGYFWSGGFTIFEAR
jgi:hypothetical protein